MEKSYAQIGKVAKSIFSEPIGISRRGQRLFVREEEILAYTKFQNYKPISGLIIWVQKMALWRFSRVV